MTQMRSDKQPTDELVDLAEAVVHERQREIVVEHLLFQTVAYMERHHPGLLDHLEESVSHLGDPGEDNTRDDNALRKLARAFIRGLRNGDQP